MEEMIRNLPTENLRHFIAKMEAEIDRRQTGTLHRVVFERFLTVRTESVFAKGPVA